MSIAKVYEISCDSHNHEDDGGGAFVLPGANLDAVRNELRAKGWEVMSDGRTHCPDCIKPQRPTVTSNP